MTFELVLQLRSPTVITSRRATGNALDTSLYVPGRSVRGALARMYEENGGTGGDPDFRRLFLAPGVRFCDCRWQGRRTTPLSSRRCADDDRGAHHGITDFLLSRGAGQASAVECHCGAKLTRPRGWLRKQHGRWEADIPQTRRVAHVEIDDRTLRSAAGQFHTSRILEEGLEFRGRIVVDDSAVATLRELLGPQGGEIRLGRGRTRGQGRAFARLEEAGPAEGAEAVSKRIASMQARLRELDPGFGDMVAVPVKFESAGVLVDRWLRPRGLLEGSDLGPELQGYRARVWFSRRQRVSGWHQAAGLPRRDIEAVEAGSVFLMTAPVTDVAAECQRIAPALTAAIGAGTGERTGEGFGEISVCDPFFVEAAAASHE